jgi:uroporphyrinogen decarboxylase
MAGLHPLEPEAMALSDLKQRIGERVCLVGNISVDRLSRGAPDEIDALVAQAIRTAGPGGGYMVASSNSVTSYCKVANVRAMVNAVQRYGHYPIQVAK